jgi:hypothetical protein
MFIGSGLGVAGTRLLVALAVRRVAWTQLDGMPPARTLGLPTPSTIGRLAGAPTDAGLVLTGRSRTILLPSVPRLPPFTATLQHAVMGGAWDDSSIPFPPHPPLQSDPRFFVYGPGSSFVMPFTLGGSVGVKDQRTAVGRWQR